MPSFKFMQIDAFTNRALGGNPCAVLLDTESLDAETMLAIALENNLSETSFVTRSERADWAARYFTPSQEIPLAGHPTIATAHALLETGRIERGQGAFTLELPAGVIRVSIAEVGGTTRFTMEQLPPKFMAVHDPKVALGAFGLSADAALPGAPVQTVSTGTPQVMIPVRGHDDLRRAVPDYARLATWREGSDFFSAQLFALQGVSADATTFARHFVPGGLFEDPFTGSATGNMGAYLWEHGLIDDPAFIAEQGHWMNRPGRAFVEVVGPKGGIETVRVGGSAVTVIRGEIDLP